MEAERGDEDGAAVAVVAGIVDVLQAGGEVNAAPDVGCIVGFDDIFAAIVEAAIAEQEAESAIGEVILVVLLDSIGDECDASAVLFAMPPGTVGAESFGESLIVFRVSKGFSLAVIPAEACEGGKVDARDFVRG